MRTGVDSYSYHRLLGELRPGEPPPPGPPLARGPLDFVADCHELGVDVCALETCFLPPPAELDVAAYAHEANGLELALSWGAPNGLEFGASAAALDDLLAWLELAPRLDVRLVRICAAGPRLRGAEPVAAQIARTVAPLRRAAAHAAELGLELALENHGDLRAAELADLLDRVDHAALGVCFDTANAPRVGDDAVEAARLLAPAIRMVHLKDVEPLERVTDPVAGPRSVPYGEGILDLDAILALVPAAAPVCVEIAQLGPGDDERALVAAGVRWLQEKLNL